MVKAIGAKRILTVVCAAVLAVGVFAATAAANPVHAAVPSAPYFFIDEALTNPTPMGNATVADIEYSPGSDTYLFYLSSEFFTMAGVDYVGAIDDFKVWDQSTGNYVDCLQGGTVPVVPGEYVYTDSQKKDVLYIQININAWDITNDVPYPHLTVYVYFDATKLP
jgi:hypothetical protein